MTAEIVIMNSQAVAMAADSAVTIRTSDERGTVFNTANKVFSLSKYAPVGIMISGNATIMDIPWETVIKLYRERLGKKRFDTLEGYCDNFFEFIDNFELVDKCEQRFVVQLANLIFKELKEELDAWLEENQDNKKIPQKSKTASHLKFIILRHQTGVERLSNQHGVHDENSLAELHEKYKGDIAEQAETFFGEYELPEKEKEKLVQIIIHWVNIIHLHPAFSSEIVIVGFGEKEYFPQCRSFHVGGIVHKKTIRSRNAEAFGIGPECGSRIISFAQSSAVRTFLHGVSPDLSESLDESLGEIFGKDGSVAREMREEIVARLGLTANDNSGIREIIENACGRAYADAIRRFRVESKTNHADLIAGTAVYFNKDELAQMARTLIHLESFRKRVVMDEETVGGPIDVAVITKGDGFIWMERKHYFSPELNHHFFKNYFSHNETQGD